MAVAARVRSLAPRLQCVPAEEAAMNHAWIGPLVVLSLVVATIVGTVLWIATPALGLGNALFGTVLALALTGSMAFAFSYEPEVPRDR
jgi:hypothetical protein